MDYSSLVSFLKLVEKKNFSEASIELNMTQPTLSQQISKLESDLGVKLINRTTRSFSITEAGMIFRKYAEDALRLNEEMLDEISKYKTPNIHKIRVGVVPTLGKIHLTKYVLSFGQEERDAEIEISEDFSERLYKSLVKNDVDVIIANKIPEANIYEKDIDSYSLLTGCLVVVCGPEHKFAKLKSVTLEECAEESIIRLSPHSSISLIIDKEFKDRGLKQKVICSCETTSNMISLVDANYGISFLSDRIAANYATENTRIIKIKPTIKASMVLCVRKDRDKSADTIINRFITHMVDVIKSRSEKK